MEHRAQHRRCLPRGDAASLHGDAGGEVSGSGFVQRVTIGDVTGDGRPDLITANTSNISALVGVGQGVFLNAVRSPFTVFDNGPL
ncbi:MAG: hypothetical protein ACREBG_18960 [Pyrinomonadaceae bacterium]